MSKSGIHYGPPRGIDYNMWFDGWRGSRGGGNKNSKLKDLGIKPNSTVVWNTVYSKYKAKLSDKVSDEVDDNKWNKEKKELSYKQLVSLDKILNKDEEELKLLGGLLSKRGWCIIEYPKQVKTIIDKTCKNVENA
eukprot:387263_1